MAAVKALVGDSVVGKDGNKVELPVDDADLTYGLYFSAHWCPPCRGFTPVLAEFYNNINAEKKRFEIIFVSSDRDEASFKDYFGSMPWLALDIKDSDKKNELTEKYGIQGIPTLVLLDSNGNTITKDGRGCVAGDSTGAKFPYKA